MLGIFSFIVLIIGAINWFFIGLLQFDFVAGLFGSQASIFSRIVYVAVGVSAVIILSILIKNKGKIVFNLSKIKEKFLKKKEKNNEMQTAKTIEASKDNQPINHNMNLEASNEYFRNDYANNSYSQNLNHHRNLEAGEESYHNVNKNNNHNSYKDN